MDGDLLDCDYLARPDVPLVVDLDGTLVAADLLAETTASYLAERPHQIFSLAAQLGRGKAGLKHFLAHHQTVDAAVLPYRPSVLALIGDARSAGREVYLATASHERHANAIARHLQLFDGVFATDGIRNLTAAVKGDLLVAQFGEGGFDYAGNSADDLEVWRHARRCFTVNISGAVARKLVRYGKESEPLTAQRATPKIWLRALRVHQYAKNILIFVPMLVGHRLYLTTFVQAVLAFVAFSIAASAIYLINDVIDIADDRGHPSKKFRPLASGLISIPSAISAVFLLLLLSAAISILLPPLFSAALAAYLALTTAYSSFLKRKMLVDVITLSLLYSARACAGGMATGIPLSHWLLAFCLFSFTSLALVKRYTELLVRIDGQLPDAGNRDYRKEDLPVIVGLAAATGSNAVTVIVFYLASPEVTLLYREPQVLWLLCPLLLFLMGRALLAAHRRQMHDDPVIWAIRDRTCQIGILLAAAIVAGGVYL